MLDSELKPWLIEVNRSPSLATDTPLDMEIKMAAVRDAFQIVDPQPLNMFLFCVFVFSCRKKIKKIQKQKFSNLANSMTQKEWKMIQAKQQQKFVKKFEKQKPVQLGLYDKCYPVSDDPLNQEMKVYREMIATAQEFFEQGFLKGTTRKGAERKSFAVVATSTAPPPVMRQEAMIRVKSAGATYSFATHPRKENMTAIPQTVPEIPKNDSAICPSLNYPISTLTTALSSLVMAASDLHLPLLVPSFEEVKKRLEDDILSNSCINNVNISNACPSKCDEVKDSNKLLSPKAFQSVKLTPVSFPKVQVILDEKSESSRMAMQSLRTLAANVPISNRIPLKSIVVDKCALSRRSVDFGSKEELDAKLAQTSKPNQLQSSIYGLNKLRPVTLADTKLVNIDSIKRLYFEEIARRKSE